MSIKGCLRPFGNIWNDRQRALASSMPAQRIS